MAEAFNIIYLPEHILIKIFSYMTYNEISEKREVCQSFNRVCSRELTKAFVRVDRLHSQIQKNIKSQLPRKESERRNHALSRFVDVLSAMETRLSLLSMTYTKYIDLDLCCFIPGKVLDELYQLLRRLQNTDSQPPRSYDLLQSLRDLSTMAMEHFEEFIVPILKAQMNDCSQSLYFSASATSSAMPLTSTLGSPSFTTNSFTSSMDMSGMPILDYSWAMPIPIVSTPFRRTPLKLDVQRVQNQMQMHSAAIATMTKECREQKVKIAEQSRIITEQDRKLQEQCRLVGELKAHMQASEKTMEVLAVQLTAITGKEVALPKPKPWDQSLWELPTARAGPSSQDTGLTEELPIFSYSCSPDLAGRDHKFKPFAPPDIGGRARGHLFSREKCTFEDDYTGLDPMAYHMNELCHGYSTACSTQRLLFQVALLIPSIAANHSLPLCLADTPQEQKIDPRDPKGIILQQLTAAQKQLSNLFEEHVGCTQCGDAADPSLVAAHSYLTPSTSRHDPALFASSPLLPPPPPPPPVANQGLMNRAQELYNRMQALSVMSLDKIVAPPIKTEPAEMEEIMVEHAKAKGKGKGPMKRGRSVSKAVESDTNKVEASETEPTGRSRKRRRR
ncbi:uncharacterized protein [Littorina saxatilis]